VVLSRDQYFGRRHVGRFGWWFCRVTRISGGVTQEVSPRSRLRHRSGLLSEDTNYIRQSREHIPHSARWPAKRRLNAVAQRCGNDIGRAAFADTRRACGVGLSLWPADASVFGSLIERALHGRYFFASDLDVGAPVAFGCLLLLVALIASAAIAGVRPNDRLIQAQAAAMARDDRRRRTQRRRPGRNSCSLGIAATAPNYAARCRCPQP
jgi:hypothetical protein